MALNASILPGLILGDDAIVGTDAAVTRDVRAGSTIIGTPARGLIR